MEVTSKFRILMPQAASSKEIDDNLKFLHVLYCRFVKKKK
jgi:hypothetical protein